MVIAITGLGDDAFSGVSEFMRDNVLRTPNRTTGQKMEEAFCGLAAVGVDENW